EITGMVYCPLRDIVVTASDMTIRVWGPDWELQMAFVGHTALVTSLVLCPVSGLLLSSSLDGTLRCWRPEVGDQVQIISIPNGCPPPLVMGGPDSAGTFFSYSTNSVDFWTFNCLYNLHCRLDGFLRGPVHQILTPPTPPSFRACVVCIHGNSDVTVVAAETGEVLTRFQANGRVRFLVILGHCGGCVSVLNMHSGKIQFRTSAHNNQNISSMQAYPNSDYLLTAGLCACHQLSMFASSSLDGTVRIWDMENHLLRTLELNAEPECLAYCESGDLLLGITGDLYRIPRTQLLPLDCRTQKWYPDSELPKSWIPIMSHECRTESCHKKDGPERQDRIKGPDFGAIMALHKDLESLQKGEVECRRRKAANIQSKREAFNNYLGLIYRQRHDIRIPEDMFDVYATLFPPKLPELPPLSPPSFTDGLSTRLHSPKTQPQKALPPIKSPTPPLTPPSEPAPTLLTSVPPSPSSALPSPISHLPEFLLQFLDEQWFQKMFPDLSCISSSLCPKEFCKHLLNFVMTCSMAQKNSILNALRMLIQQEVLDKESLSTGLLVCLENYIHKNMSREEQHFVGELLNMLVYLSPDSFDTIVELLAMLANKEADLKALVLCVLQRLGVEEAELWLYPELESWNSLTKHKPNQHRSLRDMASHWLLTWTRMYKVHGGSLFLRSEGIQSVFTPVEVLKYFCSVQKGKQTRPPPEGRKDAVIVNSDLSRLKAIQRLGETYSMSRIREPQGRLLPPLPYRPMLMDFPRFLSLPMAHVTLSPFPFSLDFQNFKRPSPQRYFFLERSYVQYYR
ncbi:hypothetical protein cypCar_00029553, partial [Cyprinus carpio]